jgi:predicted peptidase
VFAGSYLVAGQWDPERMGEIKNQNIWILVSEKDEKAFPIMGNCMKSVEAAGGKVVCGSISAKDPLEVQNTTFRRLAAEDSHIFFTWYEGDSVLPEESDRFPGAYHVNTWVHAYNLESVREWLFRCVKFR